MNIGWKNHLGRVKQQMWVILLLFLVIVHDGGAKFLAEKIVPQQLRQFVALLL